MATLNIRNIDDEAARRISKAAQVRGMTLGKYLAALAALHEVMRSRADAGDDGLQAELQTLGLETVTG